MADQVEIRSLILPVEYREDDDQPIVEGTALRYRETSEVMPGLRERFLPGAFGDVSAIDAVLNVQHKRSRPLARTGGGGLSLMDSDSALRARAELDPETTDGKDAMRLLSRKILRGFSVEFVGADSRFTRGVREIRKATLVGLGLVDTPAHRGSVAELRELRRLCRGSARRFFL